MAFQNQTINAHSAGNCPACGRTDIRYNGNAAQGHRPGMSGNRMPGNRMNSNNVPVNRMSGNNMSGNNMSRNNISRSNVIHSGNTGNSCSVSCAAAFKTPEHHEKDVFAGIDKAPLTMAYVPFQGNCNELYDVETALARGTIFPELDKPFTGGGCCEKR